MEGYKGSGQSNSLNLLTSGVGPKHPKFETKREAAALESHSASLKPTFIAILGVPKAGEHRDPGGLCGMRMHFLKSTSPKYPFIHK